MTLLGFPGGASGKEPTCQCSRHKRRVQSLEEETATLSSILAWKILWTDGPGRLHSIGLQRVGYNWETNTFTFQTIKNLKGEQNFLLDLRVSNGRAPSLGTVAMLSIKQEHLIDLNLTSLLLDQQTFLQTRNAREIVICILWKEKVKVIQSCPTLCDH